MFLTHSVDRNNNDQAVVQYQWSEQYSSHLV